jgi:23S rRNA G2445 N2-methylase RlmL
LPGAVPLLRRELGLHGIRCMPSGNDNGNFVDIPPSNIQESSFEKACKIVLNCRLMQRLSAHVREPFQVKWERQLREELLKTEWGSFYRKASIPSHVTIRASESRLGKRIYIHNLVLESFKSSRETCEDAQLNLSALSDDSLNDGNGPQLHISLNNDVMDMHVDIGGEHLNQMQFQHFGEKSRLSLNGLMGMVVATRVVDNIRPDSGGKFDIWDPFVGSGSLCISLASLVSGIPAGSPNYNYPLKNLPCFDAGIFHHFVSNLGIQGHDLVNYISCIIGSDSSIDAIATAEKNLKAFVQRVPKFSQGESTYMVPLKFDRVYDAFTPPTGSQKLVVVTSLPGGGEYIKRILHFHTLVDTLEREGRLAGAFVVTNRSHSFMKLSRQRRWLTDLRFKDESRRDVELLRLVS